MAQVLQVIAGIVGVAAVATAGDYLWYTLGVRHTALAGLLHGVVLLTSVGAVLGAAVGRVGHGLPVGALAGLGGAASYYVLAPAVGTTAILVAWVMLWLLLALFDGRWIRARAPRGFPAIAGRGLVAAASSGVTFALVMSTLWGPAPDGGRNYLVQFLAWMAAWAPGLLALTVDAPFGRPQSRGGAGGDTPRDGSGADTITPASLLERIERGDAPLILDVRSAREFAAGRIPGAINVPLQRVLVQAGSVPGEPGDVLVVYCGHGPRARMAAGPLRHAGWQVTLLSGHWATWRRLTLPIER